MAPSDGRLGADDDGAKREDTRGQNCRPTPQADLPGQGIQQQRDAQVDQQVGHLPTRRKVQAPQLVVERIGEYGDRAILAPRLLYELRDPGADWLLERTQEIGWVLHLVGC